MNEELRERLGRVAFDVDAALHKWYAIAWDEMDEDTREEYRSMAEAVSNATLAYMAQWIFGDGLTGGLGESPAG